MSNGVTGWCEQDRHDACDGVLHNETGFRWWCACSCHPDPEPRDVPGYGTALLQLQRDRAAASGVQG